MAIGGANAWEVFKGAFKNMNNLDSAAGAARTRVNKNLNEMLINAKKGAAPGVVNDVKEAEGNYKRAREIFNNLDSGKMNAEDIVAQRKELKDMGALKGANRAAIKGYFTGGSKADSVVRIGSAAGIGVAGAAGVGSLLDD